MCILDTPETHRLLDLEQPLGLLVVGVMHFIPDADDPWALVTDYRERLAPGSYLAMSRFTPDGMPERMAQAVEVFKNTREPAYPRTYAQLMRMFDGFELGGGGAVVVDPPASATVQLTEARPAVPPILRRRGMSPLSRRSSATPTPAVP